MRSRPQITRLVVLAVALGVASAGGLELIASWSRPRIGRHLATEQWYDLG